MVGNENLEQQERQLEEELPIQRRDWADHMKVRHNGRRATSCHTCINYDYAIRANEYALGEVRREIVRRCNRP